MSSAAPSAESPHQPGRAGCGFSPIYWLPYIGGADISGKTRPIGCADCEIYYIVILSRFPALDILPVCRTHYVLRLSSWNALVDYRTARVPEDCPLPPLAKMVALRGLTTPPLKSQWSHGRVMLHASTPPAHLPTCTLVISGSAHRIARSAAHDCFARPLLTIIRTRLAYSRVKFVLSSTLLV